MATEQDKTEFLRDADQKKVEEEVISHGVLDLDISDNDLLKVLSLKQAEAETFYESINLTQRRKDTNDYWKGKQIDRAMLYRWQVPYIDNVIYRDVETIIPIAISKVPDVIVGNPAPDDEKRERAKNLQRVLDFKTKSRYIRNTLRTALRGLLLNFVGVIKCRWDRVRQTFVFEPVKAANVILDHTATPSYFGLSSENFEYIAEWIEEPLKVVISKFPDKKADLFQRVQGGPIKMGTERQLANKIRYQEIWFTWYDDDGIPFEGVCWKYNDLILGKMKNPYWDYEGREETIGEDILTGDLLKETRYFNHFDKPAKPYIVINYQNNGTTGPIDETSPVEQVIPLQDIVNKRGRQITELADKANPKKVFSSDFISKEDAVDVTDDPQESIVGTGSVREGFNYVPGIPPNPVLYQDLIENRLEIDNMLGAHSTTRGERVPEESGIARQITREGDFGRIDDLVFQVVEQAADEIANWMVQFMKVFGTQENFEQVLGQNGQTEFVQFDRDSIDDGIDITVQASTVDKTERRTIAAQLASSGSIDPMSLFEDLDAKNPEERARRLAAFQAGPAAYLELIIGDQEGSQTLNRIAAESKVAEETGANPAEATQATTLPPEV